MMVEIAVVVVVVVVTNVHSIITTIRYHVDGEVSLKVY
jgi:hypothetical protein